VFIGLSTALAITLVALALDATIGYPHVIFRVIGHPVTWIGAMISLTETRLNSDRFSKSARRALGVGSLAAWLILAGGVAALASALCKGSSVGILALGCLSASLPAQRSLYEHVRAVADALETSGLQAGRDAVSKIVGRKTSALDEAGVARAAIESLAENFSDGVVAPAFWLALAGLPGGVLYKTINTADSMVGHRTPRFESFGWASARLDDIVNLPASRLAAIWLVLAAFLDGRTSMYAAFRTIMRDARRHRSPNAGWPEAAMAGALGLKLAGPRVYGETLVDDAYMGDGRREAQVIDIRRALVLYRRSLLIQYLALAILAATLLWLS
jgi:adenosylcobinamide-phosphate synthase